MKFIHAFLVIQFYFPFANKNFLPMSCEESPPTYYGIIHLGCVCFGWKWFPEIIFTLFRMFGCHGKWLPVDQYFHLWPRNDFLPSFSLQSISGKRERERERERESARVREEKKPNSQSDDCRWTLSSRWRQSPVRRSPRRSRSRDRRRDLAKRRLQSRLREIAQLIAISPSTEIAINGAISWRVDREIAPSRACAVDREIAISDRNRWWYFSWVCLFLLLFQTSENIFRKIFWNATKHMKTFSFPENSISGK